ncbi:MAG: hypothetical protein L0229_16380 [Blastocatellia bacterium]|nr:hypothetical protein [Blastocatellia bacterium]
MEQEERLNLINEIKQIERELYLKRSQLAVSEETGTGAGIYKGLDSSEWQKVFSRCIEQIGALSSGGNSVEDVAAERQR